MAYIVPNINKNPGYIADTNVEHSGILKVEIPLGMEIDTENSNFTTGEIKLKEKQISYSDIEEYLIDRHDLAAPPIYSISSKSLSNMPEYSIMRTQALYMLINTAHFLNMQWDKKHDISNPIEPNEMCAYIYVSRKNNQVSYIGVGVDMCDSKFKSPVYFRTRELAEKCICILGVETIARALYPEYE